MSTTFGVQLPNEDSIIEVAFRYASGNGAVIEWKNPLAQMLPDNTKVIPVDNSSQGIDTIGDIKKHIKEQI